MLVVVFKDQVEGIPNKRRRDTKIVTDAPAYKKKDTTFEKKVWQRVTMFVQRRDIKIISYAQLVSLAAHTALFKKLFFSNRRFE